MAKRIAEKELTDRNWDQEDEAEEVKRGFPGGVSLGGFPTVSKPTLGSSGGRVGVEGPF